MMNKLSINKNALIAAGIIIISLLFARNIWQAQTNKINSLKRIVSEEEAKIGVLGNIDNLNKKFDSYAKVLKKEDIKAIIAKINSYASSCNIEIVSIQPQSQKEGFHETYYSVPISLNIKARFHDIGKFINLVENSEQFFNIDSFNLTQGAAFSSYGTGLRKAQEKDLLSCSLVIEAIFIK